MDLRQAAAALRSPHGEIMQVLHYEYVDDVLARRQPHREGHIAHIRKWHDDGRLALAGAVGNPPNGGLLIFRVSDPTAIDDFVNSDPYQAAGLITGWWIEPCTVVTPVG